MSANSGNEVATLLAAATADGAAGGDTDLKTMVTTFILGGEDKKERFERIQHLLDGSSSLGESASEIAFEAWAMLVDNTHQIWEVTMTTTVSNPCYGEVNSGGRGRIKAGRRRRKPWKPPVSGISEEATKTGRKGGAQSWSP